MAVDLEEAERQAADDVVLQREESLAAQLKEMRHRKRKLVDPLQFEMSIQDKDLANYTPAFGWEMAPAYRMRCMETDEFDLVGYGGGRNAHEAHYGAGWLLAGARAR